MNVGRRWVDGVFYVVGVSQGANVLTSEEISKPLDVGAALQRRALDRMLRALASRETTRVQAFAQALGWSAEVAAARARLAAALLCERVLRVKVWPLVAWDVDMLGVAGPPLLTEDEAERVVRHELVNELDDRVVSWRVIQARACRMAYPGPVVFATFASRCEGPATREVREAEEKRHNDRLDASPAVLSNWVAWRAYQSTMGQDRP